MNVSEITKYDNRVIEAKMTDGSTRSGRLDVTPEEGLFHIWPENAVTGRVVNLGFAEDLHTGDFESIKVLK